MEKEYTEKDMLDFIEWYDSKDENTCYDTFEDELFEWKELKKTEVYVYEYEMFIDDKGSPFEMNTWIPISNDRIKDISRVDEYIEKGILRRI